MPKNIMNKGGLVSFLIGCLLIIPNVYWIVLAESMDFSIHITMQSIFFNSLLSILLLILINIVLKRFSVNLQLSSQQLIVIYIMINIGSAVAGHGTLQVLIPLLTHAFWYSTPENDWAKLFHSFIPSWLSVQDPRILQGFYQGFSSFYTHQNLAAWIIPILSWTGFTFALAFVMLCLNSIMRRKWVEEEKLRYPMAQLPYSIAIEKQNLFSNKILWVGFAIPAAINIMNGLHFILPSVPYLHIKLTDLGKFFVQKPWNAVGWTPISFYPFIIGLGFFIPVDLCFSLWFFFLFWKGQAILWQAIGLQTYASGSSGHSGVVQQASGALIGICVISLWSSRKYLKTLLLDILDQRSQNNSDSSELMSPGLALAGLILSSLIILFFCYFTGMSIWLIVLFFSIYFAMSLAITRIRAEVGPPVHDVFYGNPDQLLTAALGTNLLGGPNLTMFSMYWFFCRGHYSDIMPFQLEGMKLAAMAKFRSAKLLLPILAATLVGSFSCFWAYLHLSYKMGMTGRTPDIHGWEAYGQLERWLTYPTELDYRSMLFIGLGFLTAIALTIIRGAFLWWPFHPAGYALSNAWGANVTWFPLFISWVIKSLILRYGGLKIDRKAAPLFMGLILGDFLTGCIWSIIGTLFRIPTYSFWVY